MSLISTYAPTLDKEYTFQEAVQKRLIINGKIQDNTMFRRCHVDREEISSLPVAKQHALLLHGPRQKYALERTYGIPSLKSEDEVLVKVQWFTLP